MSWMLDGPRVRWRDAHWRAEADLQLPSRGWELSSADRQPFVGLLPMRSSDTAHLPPLVEHYVRGDDVVAAYPEPIGGQFGLQQQVRVLESSAEYWVGQWTIAVQTSHWDCHPMVDLGLPPAGDAVRYSADELAGPSLPAVGAPIAPAGWSYQHPFPCAIFLAPRDQAVTGYHPHELGASLRLFEEFLERGVIRKATCWVVASAVSWRHQNLTEIYQRLCATPLPLTT
jgi:hypothetical protein